MRKVVLLVLVAVFSMQQVNAQWKPVGDKIKTPWAEKVDVANPLPEYPRPQMERGQWLNLNGLWDYALVNKGSNYPDAYDGQILVPFPIESSLSGVQKSVGENQELWYQRSFTVPSDWKNKNVVLNFGAVDWQAEVWVNGIKAGMHRGGYTPFSFNITPFLQKGAEQKLLV
ncbi:MAG: beta-galactosidase, partial [Bacteroidales bacterium]